MSNGFLPSREGSQPDLNLEGAPESAATAAAAGGVPETPSRIGAGFYSAGGEAALARALHTAERERSGSTSAVVVGEGHTLAGSALEGESAGSYGKDLAEWIAALQRANHAVAPAEGRHHIKRVHVLTTRNADGLLRQVGMKQREHKELYMSPERRQQMMYGRYDGAEAHSSPFGSGGPMRVRRVLSTDLPSNAASAVAAGAAAAAAKARAAPAAPIVRGSWMWRYDERAASGGGWRRLWCVVQARAVLCFAEAYAELPSGTPAGVPEGIDLERPALVFWPAEGPVQPSSDAVGAPSPFVFSVASAIGGRRHRLCVQTREQLQEWSELLPLAARGSASAASAVAEAPLPALLSDPVAPAELAASADGAGLAAAGPPPLGTSLPEKQRALLAQRTKARRERGSGYDSESADGERYESADEGDSRRYESEASDGGGGGSGGVPGSPAQLRSNSWREAAGRGAGPDGYRFGDGARIAARKISESMGGSSSSPERQRAIHVRPW